MLTPAQLELILLRTQALKPAPGELPWAMGRAVELLKRDVETLVAEVRRLTPESTGEQSTTPTAGNAEAES